MTDTTLIEAATTAHRVRDPLGRPLPHPAWADLTPADRQRLYTAQLTHRALERAHDPDHLSATARLILARARTLDQSSP